MATQKVFKRCSDRGKVDWRRSQAFSVEETLMDGTEIEMRIDSSLVNGGALEFRDGAKSVPCHAR